MVVDTSVLLHILFEEPGWQESVSLLLEQETLCLVSPVLVEAQAVLKGRIQTAAESVVLLDRLIFDLKVDVVAFSAEHADLARQAYLQYGKGQGHPAQLNFGDVMSYALAKASGESLAFVGDDFHHTDLLVLRLPKR